jgi:hypothetical protein
MPETLPDYYRLHVVVKAEDENNLRELRTLLERRLVQTLTVSEVVRIALRESAERERALAAA